MTDKLDKPQVEVEAMTSKACELTHTIVPSNVGWAYSDRIKH